MTILRNSINDLFSLHDTDSRGRSINHLKVCLEGMVVDTLQLASFQHGTTYCSEENVLGAECLGRQQRPYIEKMMHSALNL